MISYDWTLAKSLQASLRVETETETGRKRWTARKIDKRLCNAELIEEH